jgi:hypothetical protein
MPFDVACHQLRTMSDIPMAFEQQNVEPGSVVRSAGPCSTPLTLPRREGDPLRARPLVLPRPRAATVLRFNAGGRRDDKVHGHRGASSCRWAAWRFWELFVVGAKEILRPWLRSQRHTVDRAPRARKLLPSNRS